MCLIHSNKAQVPFGCHIPQDTSETTLEDLASDTMSYKCLNHEVCNGSAAPVSSKQLRGDEQYTQGEPAGLDVSQNLAPVCFTSL